MRFLVLSLLPISFAFAEAPVISMEKNHTPCGGGECIQRCIYDADALIEYKGIEVDGRVTIKTDFDSKTSPQKPKLRTLINVAIDMVGANAYWDETSIFDGSTMRLEKAYNFLKAATGSGDKGLRQVEWAETQFSYDKVPSATVRAIGGKTGDEIKKKFPKFYKYLNDSTFGQNWMAEFDGANPERKPNRDMSNFPENVLSPTFVSLFHLRFIPVLPAFKYNLFINYGTSSNFGAFQVDLKSVDTDKSNEALIQGNLAFGDFESQPGKPAKFYINKSTNEFEKIELSMQNLKQNMAATVWTTKASCQRL